MLRKLVTGFSPAALTYDMRTATQLTGNLYLVSFHAWTEVADAGASAIFFSMRYTDNNGIDRFTSINDSTLLGTDDTSEVRVSAETISLESDTSMWEFIVEFPFTAGSCEIGWCINVFPTSPSEIADFADGS